MKELEEPTGKLSCAEIFKWEIKIKHYQELKCKYDNRRFELWKMINEQSLSLAKTGVNSVKDYQKEHQKKDYVWLLKAYKKVTSQVYSN